MPVGLVTAGVVGGFKNLTLTNALVSVPEWSTPLGHRHRHRGIHQVYRVLARPAHPTLIICIRECCYVRQGQRKISVATHKMAPSLERRHFPRPRRRRFGMRLSSSVSHITPRIPPRHPQYISPSGTPPLVSLTRVRPVPCNPPRRPLETIT